MARTHTYCLAGSGALGGGGGASPFCAFSVSSGGRHAGHIVAPGAVEQRFVPNLMASGPVARRRIPAWEAAGITTLTAAITFVLALQIPFAYRAGADVAAVSDASDFAAAAHQQGMDGMDDLLVTFGEGAEAGAKDRGAAESVENDRAYVRALDEEEIRAWADP